MARIALYDFILGPRSKRNGPCSWGGGGKPKEWGLEDLTPKQDVAFGWIFRRDPNLWRGLRYSTYQVTRRYCGTHLIAHILDAVHSLRDTPGLLRLLANATRNYHIGSSKRGREGHEIMGAAHEILRLGHLTALEDPVDVINYVEDVFPPGKGTTPSGKEQIEIDGVLRSGVALEFKLATSGIKNLDENQKDQAQRYAQILKDGKIREVQYHITTPELGPKVIKFLAETIPGVRIFRYDSLITPSGQLNTRSEEIDTDLYLWDLDI